MEVSNVAATKLLTAITFFQAVAFLLLKNILIFPGIFICLKSLPMKCCKFFRLCKISIQ